MQSQIQVSVRKQNYLRIIHEHTQICEDDKSYKSWIPGASFLTDGVQFKLPLLSERSDRTRGLDKLFDKGFSGFKEKKPSQRINITNIKKGLYHDTKDNTPDFYEVLDKASNFSPGSITSSLNVAEMIDGSISKKCCNSIVSLYSMSNTNFFLYPIVSLRS